MVFVEILKNGKPIEDIHVNNNTRSTMMGRSMTSSQKHSDVKIVILLKAALSLYPIEMHMKPMAAKIGFILQSLGYFKNCAIMMHLAFYCALNNLLLNLPLPP